MTIHRAYGHVDRAATRAGEPLRVVMASEGRQADGIDLRMSGARLDRFRGNPVLGYGHTYWGRNDLPIGRVENVTVDGQRLVGDLVFDADDEFAMKIERKMRDGFMNAVSIGFSVAEWEGKGDYWNGGVAAQWELSELSVVPIGMDANALVTAGRSAEADLVKLLVERLGAERVLAVLAPPEPPAKPVQHDPTPAPTAGVSVSADAARAMLAAFAKES